MSCVCYCLASSSCVASVCSSIFFFDLWDHGTLTEVFTLLCLHLISYNQVLFIYVAKMYWKEIKIQVLFYLSQSLVSSLKRSKLKPAIHNFCLYIGLSLKPNMAYYLDDIKLESILIAWIINVKEQFTFKLKCHDNSLTHLSVCLFLPSKQIEAFEDIFWGFFSI